MKSRKHPTTAILAAILLAILLLLAGYMGAYYANVRPERMMLGNRVLYASVFYRVGGLAAHKVFWPAHRIDRRIRPEYFTAPP